MIYITGDTHGDLTRIEKFTEKMKTSMDDIMIVLDDAGINYYEDEDEHDSRLKNELCQLPILLFCIHGNHESRPEHIESYEERRWNGGTVFVEPEYPNILFTKDREIFDFNGQKAIVLGGAYSVDKFYRLERGWKWWEDEQPSPAIKAYVETQLENNNWKVDIVLSHTTPIQYEPTEVFLPTVDQRRVDESTEKWLGAIEEKLDYKKWYAGHYHTNKHIDKMVFLFISIEIV